MRLIDADELAEGYKHIGYDPTEHPEESYMEGWCKGFNAAVDHCLHHVIHAHTIEPERKPWKWEWLSCTYDRTPCEKRFRCSECYHETIVIGMSDPWDKYCANCGAKMEGTE